MNLCKPVSCLILAFVLTGCRNEDKKAAPDTDAILNSDTALTHISRLFMANKSREAIALLEKGVKKFPGNPEYSRRLSEAYIQAGRTEEALKLIDSMLIKDSLNFEAWHEKGMLLSQTGDTAGAINALEISFTLQPLQLTGLALANLYAEAKDPRAIELSDVMLKKDNELTDAVFIKGIYYSNINNYNKALEQFEACISRDWKFTEAYIEKGIILYNRKDFTEAYRTFEMAATVTPTYADAYFWMARIQEAQGKKAEARENYSRALALDRDFTEAKEGIKRNTP